MNKLKLKSFVLLVKNLKESKEFYQNIKDNNIEILHDIKKQPWQQQVFRIKDPDGFIVEI